MCLPLTWKLLAGIIADKIYGFLKKERISPEEQKGCRKKSKSTGDQLHIDKMLHWEVKQKKKNLVMGWMDYQKAYDMVPHSRVIESLNMMGIAKNVVNFFGENGDIVEDGANLWCWDTRGSIYKERESWVSILNWRDNISPVYELSQIVFQKWKDPGFSYPDSKNI